jgi:hypothetical protein
MVLVASFSLAACALAITPSAAQNPPAPKTAAYDTPEQTKKKLFDLAVWSTDAQVAGHERDKNFYIYDTKEYADRVVAIVQKRQPRPISYDDYTSLETSGSDITELGEWFWSVVLKLGLKFQEMSRTSIGPVETVIYQWKNPDGSNVVGTFQNHRLVSKAQRGLK